MNYQSMFLSDSIDAFMTKVYALTFIGTLITLFIAFTTYSTPALLAFVMSHSIALFVIQIALVVVLAFTSESQSTWFNLLLYLVFVSFIGLSLSYIFVTYTFTSIFTILVSVSGMFAVLSAYGYFTKKDLSAFGKFLLIGLVGIIVATLVNIFVIGSSMMSLVISVLGVLVFSGLIAYDTQKIKNSFIEGNNNAVSGAVSLYLDFINLFSYFLSIFGVRK